MDTLKESLKFWGHYQNHRYVEPATDDGRIGARLSQPMHPITQARQFAPGKKADRQLLGRGGLSRRLMMGARAGLQDRQGRALPVPVWIADPIRCTETRLPAPRAPSAAVMDATPDDLRWIDRALSELYRRNMVRALCVREEFAERGTQASRAESVAKKFGGKLTVWQYRKELHAGLAFLEGKRP